MRKITLDEINKRIEENKINVESTVFNNRTENYKRATKTRSAGERFALDKLAVAEWNKAIQFGKIKRLGPNKLYFEY